MAKVWKDIEGYEGLYQVSNYGQVRSLDRVDMRGHSLKGKVLKVRNDTKGYLLVNLSKNGEKKTFNVHRLVALTLITNPENKPQVNHKNGIKSDSNVSNLEWNTSSENTQHAYDMGLSQAKGKNNGRAKLTKEQVREIYIKYNFEGGFTQRQLAKMYDMSQRQVFGIVNNQSRQDDVADLVKAPNGTSLNINGLKGESA